MIKIPYLQLLFILITALLSGPVVALASFYGDTETSDGQVFRATELVLETSAGDTSLSVGTDTPEAVTTLQPSTSEASIASLYDVAVSASADDGTGFCAALTLEAQSSETSASGAVPSFMTASLQSYEAIALSFTYNQNPAIPAGATCVVSLTTTSWQNNMSKDSAGYRDTTITDFTITLTTPAPAPVTIGFTPTAAQAIVTPEGTLQLGGDTADPQATEAQAPADQTTQPPVDQSENTQDNAPPSTDPESDTAQPPANTDTTASTPQTAPKEKPVAEVAGPQPAVQEPTPEPAQSPAPAVQPAPKPDPEPVADITEPTA